MRGTAWAFMLAAASLTVAALASPLAAAEPPSEDIALSLVGVDVIDMAKAEAFYTGVLGMRRMFASGGVNDAVQEVGLGFGSPGTAQTMIVLIHHNAGGPPLHPAKLVFRVGDARAMTERVRSAGYTVVSEPHQGAGSPIRTAMVRDAEGTLVEFFEMAGTP